MTEHNDTCIDQRMLRHLMERYFRAMGMFSVCCAAVVARDFDNAIDLLQNVEDDLHQLHGMLVEAVGAKEEFLKTEEVRH